MNNTNWLHDHKVINSPSCEICKEGKVDDMTHHFIECSVMSGMYLKSGEIELQHVKFN